MATLTVLLTIASKQTEPNSDCLKVKFSATDEHCDSTIDTAGLSVPGRFTAGTYFVLAREGTASYCAKYLSAVKFLSVSVPLGLGFL
jgi:hypothetical protein